MIAYGSITISDLSEPFSVIVSNDSIHISTDSNRVSSGAQTYTCDIVVYQGTAQKTNFSIGTIQAPSFLTTTKTANSVKFAVNSNTTITADNGTIIIPITMEGSTVNKSVTWSCAKEGIPAKAVDIYSNGLVFKSSDGGENFSPNIIRLTPIFQGGLSFNKWQYSLDNGITWKDVVDGEYGLKISDSIGKLVVSNKTLSVYADYMVTDSTLNIIDGGSVSGAKLSLKSRSVITTHSLLIAKDCALFNNSITSIVFKCLSNDDKYYDTTTVLRLHDVDDIEVGGVNLLTNTASVKQYTSDLCNWTIESKNNVSKNILDAETDSQRIVTSNATNPESGFYSVISGIQFKRKQHYVYSLAIRGTINQSTLFGMKIFYKNTSGKIVSSSDISWINDGDSVNDGISQFYFSRRYLPFTIPTDFDEVSNYLAVCLYGTNMDVQIRNFQLEKGLNPSPWRQADGDVVSTDTSITTIATVESIVDKINGEISNKISRTDTIDYKDENGQIVSSTISNFFSESTQNLYGFIWKVFNTSSGSTELSLTDGMIQAITNQFIIKDSNGKSVIIEKGNIKSHAITSLELATDAIKSLNYVADKNFSKAGTFIDLSNGIISTPSFYIDSTGTAAFKGDITTDSGNIGGFVIGASAIHSKDKSSVASISQGIYFANDGQFNFGNASQYVKFYRASEGKYKLAIAVEDLFIGSSNVADAIEDAKKTADSAASVASSASSAASTANSTANAAKSTAEGASKTASDAKSTADSASQVASNASSVAGTAKTTADTARKEASNAAKTATNYMKFDNSGLTVGDLTKNTLGRNVNIDSSSVNIRNGSNVLASFAESLIEIGKNTNTATISFLNGIVKLIGQKQTIEGTTFYDAHLLSTDMMTIGTGSTDPSSDKVNALISLNGMSGEREVLASVTDTQGHSTLTVRDSSASLYSDGDAGYSSVNVITNKSTSQVEIHTNGSNGNRALINYSHAIQYYNNSTLLAAYNGKTPCLWDGFVWMRADQTATLSAPISQQPHGIIVIFALYDPTTGGVTNVMTNPYFVPKTAINYDYVFTMFWESGWKAGVKRVSVQDTQIVGNAQNDKATFKASSGITLDERWFVLRRVYGV